MILMIYNRKMCSEFLLPNLHDSDYEIVLPGREYGLAQGMELSLEVTPEGWSIKGTDRYRVLKDGKACGKCLLRQQDILDIRTKDGQQFKVITAEAALAFCITGKYDLSRASRITIGKAESNIIRYDFRDLISGIHAELVRHSDGWYITDRSSYGVFGSEGRIQGSR